MLPSWIASRRTAGFEGQRPGQMLRELGQALRDRHDNPLLRLWAQSEARALALLPWYRRSPLLMVSGGLAAFAYSALVLWFMSLHLQHWNSILLTREYLLESLWICAWLLPLPLFMLALAFLLARTLAVLQFCTGLLSNDPKARVNTLDDMLSASQLSNADILVAAVLHCLNKLALPLLLFALTEAGVVVFSLTLAERNPQAFLYQSLFPGSLPWGYALASGGWAAIGQLQLGLCAALFSILLLIALGRGLSSLLASAAAGSNMLVQFGGVFWLVFWFGEAGREQHTELTASLFQLTLVLALAAIAIQTFAVYGVFSIASNSLRMRQVFSLAFWPLLTLLNILLMSGITDAINEVNSSAQPAMLVTTSPILLLYSGQLVSGLTFGSAIQGIADQGYPLLLIQLAWTLLLCGFALPAALNAIRLRRGNSL